VGGSEWPAVGDACQRAAIAQGRVLPAGPRHVMGMIGGPKANLEYAKSFQISPRLDSIQNGHF
jgi:hypothetical protein